MRRNDLFWIRLADSAVETMMLAAVEAYCLGDGRPKSATELETGGLLWGSRKSPSHRTEDRQLIYVERANSSLSAERATGSIAFHDKAPTLMDELVSRWSPQLSLLGDFHTHPYADRDEVSRYRGHEFSPSDIDCLTVGQHADFYWEKAEQNPVMLAMTICRLQRVRERHEGEKIDWNCFSFDIGNFRFWLRAAVGYMNGSGERCVTANVCGLAEDEPQVFLDLDTKFFNATGDRVFSFDKK